MEYDRLSLKRGTRSGPGKWGDVRREGSLGFPVGERSYLISGDGLLFFQLKKTEPVLVNRKDNACTGYLVRSQDPDRLHKGRRGVSVCDDVRGGTEKGSKIPDEGGNACVVKSETRICRSTLFWKGDRMHETAGKPLARREKNYGWGRCLDEAPSSRKHDVKANGPTR